MVKIATTTEVVVRKPNSDIEHGHLVRSNIQIVRLPENGEIRIVSTGNETFRVESWTPGDKQPEEGPCPQVLKRRGSSF